RIQIGTGARANHIPDKLSKVAQSWKFDDIAEAARLKAALAPHVKQVTPFGDNEFAQDWKETNEIERVNAYTFRGEKSRSPTDIQAAGGFHPPITRADQYYVDNCIYPVFQSYMK